MSLPQQTTVLIVGAGPAGMSAALSLHEQGIKDITIVDAVQAGENTSRAMVIHAATLEALDRVGCLDRLLNRGVQVERLSLFKGTSPLLTVNFSLLSPYTKYPFGLSIPQSTTESAMLEKLKEVGITVVRPFKVTALKQSQEHSIDAHFETGEIVRAKYIIGADGAHSIVRDQVGIAFRDPDGNDENDYGSLSQMVIGDIAFSSTPQFPSTDAKVFLGITNGNFTLVAPFPKGSSPDPTRPVYRYATAVPVSDGTAPHAPSVEFLQSILERFGPDWLSSDPKRNPHPIHIEQAFWTSRYRTRCAIASRRFARFPDVGGGGAVLLIGDAAHIHSPVGGQGMSLGIRDAISLGPVLRAHLDLAGRGAAPSDALLEEWDASRRERALAVIALTKGAMGLIINAGRTWAPVAWLGLFLLQVMARLTFVQRMVAYRLSGLAEI